MVRKHAWDDGVCWTVQWLAALHTILDCLKPGTILIGHVIE